MLYISTHNISIYDLSVSEEIFRLKFTRIGNASLILIPTISLYVFDV